MGTPIVSGASILRKALKKAEKMRNSSWIGDKDFTMLIDLISSAYEEYQSEGSAKPPVASGTTASVNLVVPHATSLTITIQPPAS